MYQHPANYLDIKQYSHQHLKGHRHDYRQITIPLAGHINTIIYDTCIEVGYGEALIISKNIYHQFYADKRSKFLIVDLPSHNDSPIDKVGERAAYSRFCLDEKTLHFISFIEKQLNSTRNCKIEQQMLALLTELINASQMYKQSDPRLIRVIGFIKQDITLNHSITSLAKVACLSESQFKVLFKQQFGCTSFEYINNLRMQLALELLLNSKLRIYQIAEQCGYSSVSAFIRRFSTVYQQTPNKLRLNSQSSKPTDIKPL